GVTAVMMHHGSTYKIYYLCTDHLGSITLLMNDAGNTVERHAYDAWGRKRNVNDWSDYNVENGKLDRGYTGHESLREFGLINMNGRMYDPILGRMLSPDNYVQDPFDLQCYNRYSYCKNNPLIYNDPSGEFWNLVIGALIGGFMNWAATGFEFSWKGLGYFAVGAAAGALSAGIGSGISSAMAAGGSFASGFVGSSTAVYAASSFATGAAIGSASGFTAGFITGFGNGLVGGDNFWESLGNGALQGLVGGAIGGAVGGLAGGIDAVADGRNFWHGGRKLVDISLPIPPSEQFGPYDCEHGAAQSVDGFYGNGRDQSYFKALEPGQYKEGLTYEENRNMYHKAGYSTRGINVNKLHPSETVTNIKYLMSDNKAIVLKYDTGIRSMTSSGQEMIHGHSTVINRLRVYDNGKFVINVMDPGGSGTSFTSLKSILYLLTVFPK
ncbi:MAG: hypothetical protein NDJ65_09065, partial [Paludibacteraceae bacterium]|nr:hypothetical protein [Paludibacteraceae bacterium]